MATKFKEIFKEILINRFDGGIVNDPRSTASNTAKVVSNFDVLTDSYRMTPYHSSESGDTGGATRRMQNFTVGYWTPSGGSYKLFGLGVVSGQAYAEISMKDLTTGGSGDLSDGGWSSPTANASASGATSFNFFTYYKKTGKIYGAKGGTNIWAFTPDGSTAFDENSATISYTNISNGLVHSKDDILYVGIDNTVYKKDGSSAWALALTLPTNVYVTSICEYGNYLAIGTAGLTVHNSSWVYLWDRDSSLTTISESLNWGKGTLKVLEQVQGELIGISVVGNNAAYLVDKVAIKRYTASGAVLIQELTGTTSTALAIAKQVINNRLYFMMSIVLNGTRREGVWSIGRNSTGQYSLAHERTPNNDTALTSGQLFNFIFVGDFLFQSYLDNSVYAISKTDDQANYTASSIYESKTINFDDSSISKKLLGVDVHTEPLPASGQIILKYRRDAETAWTTILTCTDNDAIDHPAVNIESTGDNLGEFQEAQFRVESTGGAVVTALRLRAELLDRGIF